MSGSADEPRYSNLRISEFLELVASARPAPAGGSAAALAVCLAAGLCAKAARLSTRHLSGAGELAEQAEDLRARALDLCQKDAVAFGAVLAARRPTGTGTSDTDPAGVGAALVSAAAVPAELAEVGAAVTELATRLAEGGNPNLLGDAVAAALIAEAATRAAVLLVAIDLEPSSDTALAGRAGTALEQAERAAARARGLRKP